MNPREQGFLLLTGKLGDPDRKPLTVARFRGLAARVSTAKKPKLDKELTSEDLIELGFDGNTAERIVGLLSQEEQLSRYVQQGKRMDCYPLTRVSNGYPLGLRKRLGLDSPGCLWYKGDTALLEKPMIALVGSRDLEPDNGIFAREVGIQAARQGFVLVSGNARGADKTAQEACLEQGGQVICVVADRLDKYPLQRNVLYLSEDGYDESFSATRALSRNRIIHGLGLATLVAQANAFHGGSWDGAVKNLKNRWSPLYCFRDNSIAARELNLLGADLIEMKELADLSGLCRPEPQITMEGLL